LLFLTSPPPPASTLSPYTTLFRSRRRTHACDDSLQAVCKHLVLAIADPTKQVRTAGAEQLLRLEHGEQRGHRQCGGEGARDRARSEEHTSELQSRENLVCRLLLEK